LYGENKIIGIHSFAKENNKTSCPNHEKESARKTNKILSHLDLSKKEKDLIRQIIKYHNVIPPIQEKKQE